MYHLPNDACVIGERWCGYVNGRHRSILYNCVVTIISQKYIIMCRLNWRRRVWCWRHVATSFG